MEAKIGGTPGFECCGLVVKAGGSLYSRWMVGKRVAAFVHKGGAWAEYVAVEASACFPIKKRTSWKNAAGAIANPLTVIELVGRCCEGEKVVVMTGASSSLGKQFIKYAKSKGIKTVAVVRKEEQMETLKGLGAFRVMNSEAEDFKENLTALCKEEGCKVAFDLVGGECGSKVFAALAVDGIMHSVGFLSGKPLQLPVSELIFKRKTAKGFYLGSTLRAPLWKLLKIRNQVISLLDTDLSTDVQAEFPMERCAEALQLYTSNLSGGKVHLVMRQE